MLHVYDSNHGHNTLFPNKLHGDFNVQRGDLGVGYRTAPEME